MWEERATFPAVPGCCANTSHMKTNHLLVFALVSTVAAMIGVALDKGVLATFAVSVIAWVLLIATTDYRQPSRNRRSSSVAACPCEALPLAG